MINLKQSLSLYLVLLQRYAHGPAPPKGDVCGGQPEGHSETSLWESHENQGYVNEGGMQNTPMWSKTELSKEKTNFPS